MKDEPDEVEEFRQMIYDESLRAIDDAIKAFGEGLKEGLEQTFFSTIIGGAVMFVLFTVVWNYFH
jgi:hypothetical protein